MQISPRRRVAVMIDTDDSWGQGVVASILEFSQLNRWGLLLFPRDDQGRWKLPAGWTGDGVIALLRDQQTQQHLRQSGLPVVDLSYRSKGDPKLGHVTTDNHARAQMSIDYFKDHGFRHFACFAPPSHRYPRERALIFAEQAEKAGFEASVYTEYNDQQQPFQDDVSHWLKQLPRPLAVFACDPYAARSLVEICQWEGIKIPQEVAVLSGDTDELLCCSAKPTISSIELRCRRIAEEGCKLLDRMMNGEPVPAEPILVPPLRVTARQSTDTYAVDDPEMASILKFVEEQTTAGIRVRDILRKFPISRRMLEMRFTELIGRTPGEEIRRRRLEHAQRLLMETDLTVEAVAAASGISSGAELASAFRRHLGIKPGELRQWRQ